MAVMEQTGLFRYYLPLKKHSLFIQAEAGGSILFEDRESFMVFSGGLAAGWRITLKDNFYIEPFARGGYPFGWGAGIMTGITTKRNEVKE
jgi:hypothetical protein